MADFKQIDTENFKQKSFWQKPEGVTGAIFLAALVGGGGFLLYSNMAAILRFLGNTIGVVAMLIALAALIYMVLDPKMRNLLW